MTKAIITTSISHITAKKKKKKGNMKLLGMQSLSCLFHSYSANSSKGKKKVGSVISFGTNNFLGKIIK